MPAVRWNPDIFPVSQVPLWPTHPPFKVDVATFPALSPPFSVLLFWKRRVGEWESLDVTSRWQMAPHWDIGRRIYGRGQMLILNLRRCAVLHPLPHLLSVALSLLPPLSAASYLFLSPCHCTMPFSTLTPSSVRPAFFQSLLTLLLLRTTVGLLGDVVC